MGLFLGLSPFAYGKLTNELKKADVEKFNISRPKKGTLGLNLSLNHQFDIDRRFPEEEGFKVTYLKSDFTYNFSDHDELIISGIFLKRANYPDLLSDHNFKIKKNFELDTFSYKKSDIIEPNKNGLNLEGKLGYYNRDDSLRIDLNLSKKLSDNYKISGGLTYFEFLNPRYERTFFFEFYHIIPELRLSTSHLYFGKLNFKNEFWVSYGNFVHNWGKRHIEKNLSSELSYHLSDKAKMAVSIFTNKDHRWASEFNYKLTEKAEMSLSLNQIKVVKGQLKYNLF